MRKKETEGQKEKSSGDLTALFGLCELITSVVRQMY